MLVTESNSILIAAKRPWIILLLVNVPSINWLKCTPTPVLGNPILPLFSISPVIGMAICKAWFFSPAEIIESLSILILVLTCIVLLFLVISSPSWFAFSPKVLL